MTGLDGTAILAAAVLMFALGWLASEIERI